MMRECWLSILEKQGTLKNKFEKNELTLDPNTEAKTTKLLKAFFVQNGKAKKNLKTIYQQ